MAGDEPGSRPGGPSSRPPASGRESGGGGFRLVLLTREANARRGVVLVPLRAVRQSKQAGGKVVTIEGQGVRVVKTGTSDSKEIEIISGVNDGERLFIAAAKVGGAAQKPGAPSSEARNMRKMMGGR